MSEAPNRELPPATFSSFTASLAASAMSAMGEGPGEETNLPMARHTIDLLGLLREKTDGNLTEEEQKLMDTLLYECRMRFVERSKSD